MEEEVEIWKDIPGYEGLYKVSNLGRVKSFHGNGRILKQIISVGYYFVILCDNNRRKRYFVHVLMAIVFLGHKPCGMKLVPDHIDGNRLNNRISNIRIVTQRENCTICFMKNKSSFSSQYTGVCWEKRRNKWKSRIRINGIDKHLGYFLLETEASNAYQKALSEL